MPPDKGVKLPHIPGMDSGKARSLGKAGFATVKDLQIARREELTAVEGIDAHFADLIKDAVDIELGGVLIGGPGGERAIEEAHAALGGDSGRLGSAVSRARTNADGVGMHRRYENGRIYWAPRSGAHAVFDGPIMDQWTELGRERATVDSLRYPTGDEQRTSDGDGRVQHFDGGAIFWSAQDGAVVVRDLPTSPYLPVLFRHKLERQGPKQGWLVLEQSFDDLALVQARNTITSLYVPDGWAITVFEQTRYRGDSLTLMGPQFVSQLKSVPRASGGNWSDAIASVRVDARSPEAEVGYRGEPPHGELVVQWAGVVSNGEGAGGAHGPHGNLHVLIFEVDEDRDKLGKAKGYPTALRHVVLPGPTSIGEWDDGQQKSFRDGPLGLFRWRHDDDAVLVFVYESDRDGLFTDREHDPIFLSRVDRQDTVGAPREYQGGEPDTRVFDRIRDNNNGQPPDWLPDEPQGRLYEGMPNMFVELETVDRADRYFDKEANTDWRFRQTFIWPRYAGYRLDWCKRWGEACGEPAARAWAGRFLNFDAVVDFDKDDNVGLTKVISSDELCTSRACDGFSRITIE